MSEVRDRTYTDSERVDVDGVAFVDCTFESAQLCYAGGEHPTFQTCTFGDMGWYFTGAALRTIQLLQAQNVEGGAQAMIDDMFKPGNYIGD